MPGWRLENNFNGTMHGLNLGVGQHVAANILCELARASADSFDLAFEKLWHRFENLLSRHKLQAHVVQCSSANLGVDKSIMVLPELKIKAAPCEKVVLWLADFASTDCGTLHARIRHDRVGVG